MYANFLCRECISPDEPLAFLANPTDQTESTEGGSADTKTPNINLTENQLIILNIIYWVQELEGRLRLLGREVRTNPML